MSRFELAALERIFSVVWHPKKEVLLVGLSPGLGPGGASDPAMVVAFDARSGKRLAEMSGARTIAFNSNGTRFLTTYIDALLWDAASFRKMRSVPYGGKAVTPLFVFGSDQIAVETFATTSPGRDDDPIGDLVIDVRTGKRGPEILTGPVLEKVYASTRAGRRLFALTYSDLRGYAQARDLTVWDVTTGARTSTLEGEAGSATLAVLDQGRFVATSAEGRVRILRPSDGAKLFVHAVEGVDSCEPVIVDPGGRFEGNASSAASVVHYRLGDDLRRSKIVRPGDAEAEEMRVQGAVSTFFAAP